MVEFALVAPLFFAALFAALDGGLLMFSSGAVNHATGVGMITLAQEGTSATADTDAVKAMMSGGIAAMGFAKLDEVDIYLIHIDPTSGVVTQDTNACGGAACVDRYGYSAGTNTVTVLNGGGTAPWPPGARNTASGNLTNIGITVKSHYSYFAFTSSQLSLTQTRYFRLEPTS
jgi:Flp pilus assembly protein TadG